MEHNTTPVEISYQLNLNKESIRMEKITTLLYTLIRRLLLIQQLYSRLTVDQIGYVTSKSGLRKPLIIFLFLVLPLILTLLMPLKMILILALPLPILTLYTILILRTHKDQQIALTYSWPLPPRREISQLTGQVTGLWNRLSIP